MAKLLQINCDANWGSIGKIAEQLGIMVQHEGWESYIAYGRDINPSQSSIIRIGTKRNVYAHYLHNILYDGEGLASRNATKRLISRIRELAPSIIHLHNLHDHYINYELLFTFLKEYGCPVIWTHHDCWAFTGGCMYFSKIGCDKWKDICGECPQRRSFITDMSRRQLEKKKLLFTSLDNLTVVAVSQWLNDLLCQSFFKEQKIVTIYNGIDLETFHPQCGGNEREKYRIGNNKFYMAAATAWSERKGLGDYLKLAQYLQDDERLVLVGLSKKQARNLPKNIVAIPRTQNTQEMAALYSEASIILNLSYEETFGLTTAEGFACGTPSIVYNCTASPELISDGTGAIVNRGDIRGVVNAIRRIDKTPIVSELCLQRARNLYDKNVNYVKYMELYKTLVNKRIHA